MSWRKDKKVIILSTLVFVLLLTPKLCLPRSSSDKVKTLLEKAEIYSRRGNHYMALKLCNTALNIQPRNMDIYYRQAFCFGRAGNYVNAIKDFTLVIKRDKSYSHAPRFRADCLVALGNYRGAVADYLTFLRKHPKDGKVWSYLAETYALMGRSDLALRAVNKGLATGSHWSPRLKRIRNKILTGQKVVPHKPFSN